MEIKENIENLSKRIADLKDKIDTEEATKTAFVMPFIQLLGYDIFNPIEVIPEFIADISNKKGEKVDYCIQKENNPIMLIECKHWQDNLELHKTQLERYFNATSSKFGILTNGIKYQFYTDLEETNKMDKHPFFIFNLEDIKDNTLKELSKFHKDSFDVDKVTDSAETLKFYNLVRDLFEQDLQEPSVELVRLYASQVSSKKLTSKVLEKFTPIVKKAINSKINETIKKRLDLAVEQENSEQTEQENPSPDEQIVFKDEEKGIITTQEEINAFNIVIDILKDEIETDRISYRDYKEVFSVLLDDTNRQPICKFWFNRSQKYISLIGNDKKETKEKVDKIEHIYKFSDKIIDTVKSYLNG